MPVSARKENDPKKIYLNLYISPEVKEFLEEQAEREGRPLSNLCDRLLNWSAKFLRKARDSQYLLEWDARGPKRIKHVSEEVQIELHEALDLILERAPSSTVNKIAGALTDAAGKCEDK